MQNQESSPGIGLIILIGAFVLVGYVAIAPQQPTTPPQGSYFPMLQDPEAEQYTWEYQVWAATPEEATSKCRQAAEQAGLTEFLPPPKQITKRRSPYGQFLFSCQMQSEDTPIPYADPTQRQQPNQP